MTPVVFHLLKLLHSLLEVCLTIRSSEYHCTSSDSVSSGVLLILYHTVEEKQ